MLRLLFFCFYMFGFLLKIDGHEAKQLFDVESASSIFHKYIQDFNKRYGSTTETINRLEIFKQNLIKINELNKQHSTAVFGLTKFTDRTPEEFMKLHTTSYKNITDFSTVNYEVTVPVDSELDWRKKGVVTEVKDQLNCDSGYAFSAVGEVEGQLAIRYKKLISLSAQYLVDCAWFTNDCKGGLPHIALKEFGFDGFITEESYPYKGLKYDCTFNGRIVIRTAGGYAFQANETDLANLLSQHGPISIALESSLQMMHYVSGILLPTDCFGNANNAVLLVGYGPDYWIIKNSYGKNWGEDGYMRLARGHQSCAIGSYAAVSNFIN